MQALTLSAETAALPSVSRGRTFPGIVGFYFVSRVAYTFLFFQADPALGPTTSIGIDLALLLGACLYTAERSVPAGKSIISSPFMRWILVYLLFTLTSILWTGAQSVTSAVAYWGGMAMDVAIVSVLLRRKDPQTCMESLMKGAVWGAAAVAVVAWLTPLTEELRLGNDKFLHPNALGPEFAIAILFAQYLTPQGRRWKWLGIALAITLLRTLSKTTIVAFVVAEAWYLFVHMRVGAKGGLRIVLAVLAVIGLSWGAINSYLVVYNGGNGNQFETLTGRTILWATALSMALEQPWIGHGFYSFRSLIPAFGPFEPWEAHNELLQHFFEFGVVGIVLLVCIYGVFFRTTHKAKPSAFRALALTVLIYALVHGVTDTVPFGFSYPLWLMSALTITLHRAAEVAA
jgi:exopolysaccharide production protein ExoQ